MEIGPRLSERSLPMEGAVPKVMNIVLGGGPFDGGRHYGRFSKKPGRAAALYPVTLFVLGTECRARQESLGAANATT